MTDALPDHDRPRHAALNARVRDLRLRYRLDADGFLAALLHFYADCLEQGCWPEAILAMFKADKADLDNAQDPALTLVRMSADLERARQDAAKEAAS